MSKSSLLDFWQAAALLALLKAGRIAGLVNNIEIIVSGNKELHIPIKLLREALFHKDEDVRLDALQLICVHPKLTMAPGPFLAWSPLRLNTLLISLKLCKEKVSHWHSMGTELEAPRGPNSLMAPHTVVKSSRKYLSRCMGKMKDLICAAAGQGELQLVGELVLYGFRTSSSSFRNQCTGLLTRFIQRCVICFKTMQSKKDHLRGQKLLAGES